MLAVPREAGRAALSDSRTFQKDSQLLREMMLSVMTDLRGLPLAVSDPEWAQTLDEERLKGSKEDQKKDDFFGNV